MSIISPEKKLTTVISILRVDPKNQNSVIDTAIKNSQNIFEKKPGFISENVLKSFDGTSVVNYSQWKSVKSYDEAMTFPYPENLKTNRMTIDFDSSTYELAFFGGISPTTISKTANLITIINKFSVEPGNQKKLLKLLDDLRVVVEKIQGFISANVHRSIDGKSVISYAQWQTKQDYEDVYTNSNAKPLLDEIKKISKFSWNLYQVVYTT